MKCVSPALSLKTKIYFQILVEPWTDPTPYRKLNIKNLSPNLHYGIHNKQ